MSSYAWLAPGYLWLLLLLPLAFWWRRTRGAPAVLFAPAPFLAGAPRSWRLRLAALPAALTLLGLVLLPVALARPAERVLIAERHGGLDLVLCLDVSSSMTARDLDPRLTRLEVSQRAARLFLAGRPHDRIGLVAFARYPDLICPPTLDHESLTRLLDGLQPVAADGQEDATGIGAAVGRAAQVLDADPARSRVVIVLTDGEENVATPGNPEELAPADAARIARALGVRIYAIAAGLGRLLANGQAEALDTRPLEALAHGSGGEFFRAQDAAAVGEVYARIGALETQELEEPRHRLEDRFVPLLAAGLALLLLGRVLAATVWAVLP